MKSGLLLLAIGTLDFLLGSPPVVALDPSLEVSQYAHTVWTVQSGSFKGNIYAMAQTPDGYLWLGTEFGLLRFDGVHSIPWQPPAGQQLPDPNINSLLVTRDGTLWIGTFAGLVTWSNGKLTPRPEPGPHFASSLFEDREGTVWVGTLDAPAGRLYAIRSGSAQCYGENGAFGRAVWSLFEDKSGNLWAAAQSGLWRMKPGPPKRYPTSTELIGLSTADNERLLIALHGAGLMQLAGDNLEPYPVRSASSGNRLLTDRDVDSNRLLRDRDGSLWIGTVERGLIHIHNGRTDVYSRANGLSGDVVLSLFEDEEGDVWVATTGGLDRFRELPVATVSVKQGLSSDATQSVLAAADGSIWIGAHEGLTRWKDGQATIFGKGSGLPDDAPESLFQDDSGRILVSTRHGFSYFKDGRFAVLNAVPSGEVHFIAGDQAGNLWLAEHERLLHLLNGRLVEQIPWSQLGRRESAADLLADRERGGVWLGYWADGGLSYFKDGQIRASYTAADGLGEGQVSDLRFDREGALWAATERGGLSRIKDGRIATLTTRNGLPCNTIHWSIEDDERSSWLYTRCGLVRITRAEMDAWIADPKRRVETTVWDAADGVRLRSSTASAYGPRIARSADGKLWFVTGEGVQIVDPRHLAFNKLPPPVHIEQITADHEVRFQNLWSGASSNLSLPPLSHDLEIDYTALSLVAPDKVRFKYKLEGYGGDWQDAGNRRQAFYTNLSPADYRFRVIAANNSGVWNEAGASLDFTIAPATYQTSWFRMLCVLMVLALLWMFYQLRVRAFRRRQAVLEQHQSEIRALNEQLIKAQEAERMRISGELHDGVLQQITSLSLRLGTVKYQIPPDSEAKDTINCLQGELIHIGTGIRHLSHELHPALLQESGLPAALTSYCQEFSKVRGLPVSCDTDETVNELSPGAALCLYRIAQEALGNAAKHAHAQRVEVRLTRSDGRVALTVSDDGVGCAPGQIGRSGGLGLINMRERVFQLNGTFEFSSEPGRGATLRVTVPFRPAT